MIRQLLLLSALIIIPITVSSFVATKKKNITKPISPICAGFSQAISGAFGNDIVINNIDSDCGTESLSAANIAFIESIQPQMDLGHTLIYKRRMNQKALEIIGHSNAFVTFKDNVWYLFLDEDWFNSLNMQEKRFIIGHECAHILHKHTSKKSYVQDALNMATEQGKSYLDKSIGDSQAKNIHADGLDYYSNVVYTMANRCQELEADKLAIEKLHCEDGLHFLTQRFDCMNEARNANETHPSWMERKAILQNRYKSVPNALKL
jgi:hypothetical protein